MPLSQYISKLPCAVVVLDVFRNTFEYLTKLLPELLLILEDISENNVYVISEQKDK